MTPRDTFNMFVRPAAADYETAPGAVHRAVSALCHIDALAEEVWHATNKPEGSKRRYRDYLKGKCIELGYAWDIHDIHKHGMLTSREPILPNGRRPQVVRLWPAVTQILGQQNMFMFRTGGQFVNLTLRDGTVVRALEVIKKCADWWDAELSRLGWP
jgi:hypothetical protein